MFNAWRSLGAIGLAILVVSGSVAFTGLGALQGVDKALAPESPDDMDVLARQFEVAYLELALGVDAARDNILPLYEVEIRRESLLGRLARFNAGEAGSALEVSPEITRLARQLEGVIRELPLAEAAPNLDAAARILAAARPDAGRLRAEGKEYVVADGDVMHILHGA